MWLGQLAELNPKPIGQDVFLLESLFIFRVAYIAGLHKHELTGTNLAIPEGNAK
jgi:hypothetical protein